MSIWQKNWFWNITNDSQQRSLENPSTGISEHALSQDTGNSKDYIVVDKTTILSIPEFWRAIQIKSGIMASLPFSILRIEGEAAIKEPMHPISTLININPSPLYSAYSFIETLVLHLDLYGNFYAKIKRNRLQEVIELQILDPTKVKVEVNDRGVLVYKETIDKAKGVTNNYSSYRIFHVHNSGLSGMGGTDVISTQKENFVLAIAYRNYIANFNANGTFMSGVLEVPHQLKDGGKRLRESFMSVYSGANKAGKVGVLEENVKYNAVTVNPNDAGSQFTKESITADISRLTGVPKILLEDYSDATLNNAEHIGQFFVNYTVRPLAEKIEAEIYRKLLNPIERRDRRPNFDLKGLLRPDAKSQAAFIESLAKYGIINDDEARNIVGMNPKPDGSGKIYHKPLNYSEVDESENDETN